jgi:dihydropteroate synthase
MKRTWKAGRFELVCTQGQPLIMGIVNVTPDSFSDGGKYNQSSRAIEHARKLVEDGAHILDIGGESTRPGAMAVNVAEEWARLADVLKELVSWNLPVSVDTMKTEIMARAVDSGADILNDVNGFREKGADQVLSGSNVGAVVMHMQGEPRSKVSRGPCSNCLFTTMWWLMWRSSSNNASTPFKAWVSVLTECLLIQVLVSEKVLSTISR